MKQINLGIIGCGIAARELHWPHLSQLTGQYKITAVCNHTEAKAREFAEMAGGVPYDLDYRNLLKRPDVEAVSIALPINLNRQVIHDALEAGKHVIAEKPLAASMEEADELRSYPAKYAQVMMIGENYRYRQTFRRLIEIMESGALGQPYSIIWNLYYHLTQDNKYAQTGWRQDPQYPGGFILDGGVHNIAALRLLAGDFTQVTAQARSVNPALGGVDTLNLQARTDQDILCQLNICYSAHGYASDQLTILGTAGSLTLERRVLTIRRTGAPDERQQITNDHGGFREEFIDFYNCIVGLHQPVSTFEAAYWDFCYLVGALEAAENRTVVSF